MLDFSRPCVMGVLNVTPDSFSDGGRWIDPARAVDRALEMVAEGAAIIDVGGESTRPGAAEVSAEDEIRRVVPVIERVAARVSVPVSVDTSKVEVMRAALAAGARIVNDVRALREPGALDFIAGSQAMVCLMHMQGEPRTMQQAPVYADVVTEVRAFLAGRVQACESAGIERQRLLIDPGFGFGKTIEHNLALLRGLAAICDLGVPMLVGLSRKSMLGRITGREASQRVAGSVALATIAVLNGARIVRAHDVAATVDAVAVAAAVRETGSE